MLKIDIADEISIRKSQILKRREGEGRLQVLASIAPQMRMLRGTCAANCQLCPYHDVFLHELRLRVLLHMSKVFVRVFA